MPEWIDDNVDRVCRLLSDEQLARYEEKFGDAAAFTGAMCRGADKLVAYLANKGEKITRADRPLVVAATLTWRTAGVYTEPGAAAGRFAELCARRDKHPDLDLGLLLRANEMSDEVLSRLAMASATVTLLHVRCVPIVPSLLAMVTCAVADPAVSAETTADTVLALVDGALADAARVRAMMPDAGELNVLPGPGNIDLFAQVAALRAAVDRHRGNGGAELADLVTKVADVVRGHVNHPRRFGRDADPVLALLALPKFIGGEKDGEVVAQMYRALHPAVVGLDARRASRPQPEITFVTTYAPEDTAGVVAHLVAWAMAELFAGADRLTCVHLRQWIVEQRPKGDIMVLLDRLRRLDARFRITLPEAGPEYDLPTGADVEDDVASVRRVLTERITRMVRAGLAEKAVSIEILPPLWLTRGATVTKVGRKLHLATSNPTGTTPSHTKLAAAVVVRAPFQFFQKGGMKGRQGSCACGARTYSGKARTPAELTQICPHRTWEEPGFVEDYATLAQLSETISPDGVRQALGRYDGPFADWVREACDS